MYPHNITLRNSGRTTRMLKAAAEHAQTTTDVVFVFGINQLHADQLSRYIQEMYKLEDYAEWFTRMVFRGYDAALVNVYNWTVRTILYRHRMFIDHAAIEKHFGRLLIHLHTYDSPENHREIPGPEPASPWPDSSPDRNA